MIKQKTTQVFPYLHKYPVPLYNGFTMFHLDVWNLLISYSVEKDSSNSSGYKIFNIQSEPLTLKFYIDKKRPVLGEIELKCNIPWEEVVFYNVFDFAYQGRNRIDELKIVTANFKLEGTHQGDPFISTLFGLDSIEITYLELGIYIN